MATRFIVVLDGEEYPVEVREEGLQVLVKGRPYGTKAEVTGTGLKVRIGRRTYKFTLQGKELRLRGKPLNVRFRGYFRQPFGVARETAPGSVGIGGIVKAPMPGRVVAVTVKEGDSVVMGAPLLILEAMKMQNEIPSPYEGIVREVKVGAEALVGKEDVLMVIQ